MNATSKPHPGSRGAVLDSVVRAVAEGRYRMAQLQLLWHRDRVPFEEMAELVTSATEMPAMPPGLTAEAVLAREGVLAKAQKHLLPPWLAHQVENEVRRIFAGQPVGGASPVQLVARVAAAMCIDVSAESIEAGLRVDLADPTLADEIVVADLTDHDAHPESRRLIHLGTPDTIDLDEAPFSDSGRVFPPSPR